MVTKPSPYVHGIFPPVVNISQLSPSSVSKRDAIKNENFSNKGKQKSHTTIVVGNWNGDTDMDHSISVGIKPKASPPMKKRSKKTRVIQWLSKKFNIRSKNVEHQQEQDKDPCPLNMNTLQLTAWTKQDSHLRSRSTGDIYFPSEDCSLNAESKDENINVPQHKSSLDPGSLPATIYMPDYRSCELGYNFRSCSALDTTDITQENSIETMTLRNKSNGNGKDNTFKENEKLGSLASCRCHLTIPNSELLSVRRGVSSGSLSKLHVNMNSKSHLSTYKKSRVESGVGEEEMLHPELSPIPVSGMKSMSHDECTEKCIKFLSEHDFKEHTSATHLQLSVSSAMSKYMSSSSPISSLCSTECDSAIEILSPDEEWQDTRQLSFKTQPNMDKMHKPIDFSPPVVIVTDYCDTSNEPIDIPQHTHSSDLLDINNRKYSSSSITSDASDYSTISSSSNEDRPVKNNWKKIKSAVQWSPFIQHLRRNKYPWIQLAGHQGSFEAGDQGTILKKLNLNEQKCYNILLNDSLKSFVPQSKGETVKENGEKFLQLQDLLAGFDSPSVMDIKMGIRTYLEEELEKARENPKLRSDMYDKMVEVDPSAPTPEELAQKAITKPRYMQWRETISSSASLGFRIEGIKQSNGESSKDFKRTRTWEQVQSVFADFVDGDKGLVKVYATQLRELRTAVENSKLFKNHEVIGSSLLFIHSHSGKAGVWLIDFGKTTPLPGHVNINHRNSWVEGNHEDGYLFGLDNVISVIERLL